MVASTQVLAGELATALKTLTPDEAKELFIHLKVSLHSLNSVSTNQSGNMAKICYIQLWLDSDLEADWYRIVEGLERIEKKALADRLARQYCGSQIPTASVSCTDLPTSLARTSDACSHGQSSPSDSSLHPMACSSSPSSPSDRVSQVRAEIDRLSDTFSDLISDTRDEMCVRQGVEPSFLKKFRDRLLDLPVSKKAPHVKFFDEKLDDFLNAKNMDKIFAILRRYCSYRNYAVLQEVVKKFCEGVLQQRMQEYCKSLESFEKATTVDVYLEAIEASDVLLSEFTKMTVKINKPASQCTLHEVRKTTEAIAEKASLQSYSVYIGAVLEGSVQLELGFPANCVGWILGAMTPDFLATHLVIDVVLHQQHLLIVERTQMELNEELCAASWSGDVMRVASLLNSGADIQTKDMYSDTPLDCASLYGYLQVVRLLISRGAKLNATNGAGYTALMNATNNNKTDVVKELISLGADVDIQDNNGDSAVIIAIMHNRPAILRQLVRAGSDLNLQNQEGLTALMIAARSGRTDITNILLEGEHVNLDIQENAGDWTALHFSAEKGDSATTYALVKAGADIYIRDKNGWTALEIAEVKSADTEATVIPEWNEDLMCDDYHEGGQKDYRRVIEILKGNYVQYLSQKIYSQSSAKSSKVGDEEREMIEWSQ